MDKRKAAWLSQKTKAGGDEISKSRNNATIQVISLATTARARYSISAEEHDTIAYFFDSRESPKNTQKPIVECLVSTQLPQSTSA